MSTAVTKEALPNPSLAQEHLDVFLGPLPGRQCLQEHHDFLEVHLQELFRPFHQECCANIKMKLREALFFRLLRVSEKICRTLRAGDLLGRHPTF
jgi:hypothetical protein